MATYEYVFQTGLKETFGFRPYLFSQLAESALGRPEAKRFFQTANVFFRPVRAFYLVSWSNGLPTGLKERLRFCYLFLNLAKSLPGRPEAKRSSRPKRFSDRSEKNIFIWLVLT